MIVTFVTAQAEPIHYLPIAMQQHQMVYAALQGRMGNELHALALQTSAPDDA